MNETDTREPLTTSAIAEASRDAEAPARIAREVEEEDREEGQRPAGAPEARSAPPDNTPLFSGGEADRFRSEWDAIQIAFVDDPRRSVERADELVAQTIKRLAEIFAEERTRLEAPWSRGEQVSTEKLRVALQRYRSFFGRLLAA